MNGRIEIYGQENCRYCVAAVNYCLRRGYPHICHDIADPLVRAELLERAPRANKTVPQIFIGQNHFGGLDGLRASDHVVQQLLGGS